MHAARDHGSLKEALAGAAAGLAAGYVMEKAQARIARLGSEAARAREQAEPATHRVAQAVARPLGLQLSDEQKRRGGRLVHYATSALWGGLFGLAARRLRLPPLAAGVIYGTAVWLVNDELLVPLLGFARPPRAYPASVHLKALAAHVVYGAATAEGRRLVRGALH